MLRVLFSFFLKLSSYHPYTFTSPLQKTLKQNHRASHNCYRVKNMSKLLAFKWLLNELLPEIEWSKVMLMWWFVSSKFLRSFLKFSFLISLFKRFPLWFQLHWKNCPYSICRYYQRLALFCFSSVFFPQKGIIFFFVFAHFLNKIVKPNCKTPFSKLLKGYICYIFLI